MKRRKFLSATLPAVGGMMVLGCRYASGFTTSKSILDYGAKPDGKTLNTKSIQRAIDAVFQAGGGTVVVPGGTFLTGLIELKSRVTLNLAEGSTLLGSTSMEDYSVRAWFRPWWPQSAASGLRDECGRHCDLRQRTN